MFNTIMMPVDLAHKDKLVKALQCTADLARHYDAKVVYVGVAAATPGAIAHSPEEFREKLADFAASQAAAQNITAAPHAIISHDPATDLDPSLLKAVKDTGADLVVMASHIPNITDYIWPSNGGSIAAHSSASVMVVRD